MKLPEKFKAQTAGLNMSIAKNVIKTHGISRNAQKQLFKLGIKPQALKDMEMYIQGNQALADHIAALVRKTENGVKNGSLNINNMNSFIRNEIAKTESRFGDNSIEANKNTITDIAANNTAGTEVEAAPTGTPAATEPTE